MPVHLALLFVLACGRYETATRRVGREKLSRFAEIRVDRPGGRTLRIFRVNWLRLCEKRRDVNVAQAGQESSRGNSVGMSPDRETDACELKPLGSRLMEDNPWSATRRPHGGENVLWSSSREHTFEAEHAGPGGIVQYS